jgi:hypothetical protein
MRHGDDGARRLVARNKGILGHPPLVIEHGQIGVANSAVGHFDFHFFRPEFAEVELEWLQRSFGFRSSVTVDDGHGFLRVFGVKVQWMLSGKGHPKHGSATFGLFSRGFVLNDVPMLSQHAVFHTNNVRNHPRGRKAVS